MAYITNTIKNVTGTSIYIDDALQDGFLYKGVNNITQTNNDLPFVIDLNYYSTSNPYYDAIYSEDDRNDLKIWFNGVELENAGNYCEKITRIARILPNDGSKRFSLDNFMATSLEVILHNVDLETIQDQVEISIGTLVSENTYEYVPLGIFNIQDGPENDKGKITLKLRDNRVKFDFNYNAQPLIERLGGKATKMQILNDICSIAGVVNTIDSFYGENDEVAIYDNTIKGATYVSYLMEQAGLIAVIDRQGRLAKVDLSNLYTWRIPARLLERDYEVGSPYKIDRVVYESGIIKYETSQDETLDTLYLNSANPYITSNEQVQYIYNKLKDFVIDSVETKRILGNPAIDPYDLIEVYNDSSQEQETIFKTLANTTYTFNGKHRDIFDTQIGIEQRKENVSVRGEPALKNYAKTSIDNLNAEVNVLAGKIVNLSNTINGVGSITLENAYAGTLHRLEISGNISCLFPSNELYPSSTLHPDYIVTPKETILIVDNDEYILDIDYLEYISAEEHDTFVYEDGKCWIERTDGIIEEKSDLIINVKSNSNISMDYFDNVIFKCTYLLENDYTDTFTNSLDIVSKINMSPEKIEIDSNKISLKGKTIDLTSDLININSKYFKVDKEGILTATSATLSGKLNNYSKEGYLAISIGDTKIKFYDYKGTGINVGGISSTRSTSANTYGITHYVIQGGKFVIGYKDSEDDNTIKSVFEYDTNNNKEEPPWIKNTVSGTIFSKTKGGIKVKNGLITNWDLDAATGIININEPNNHTTLITVKSGIITDWEYQ